MTYKIHKQYRLPGYDYSRGGYYFVTICTKNREHFFGKIMDEKMQLSPIGKIVQKFWLEIPDRFPVVMLDEFIVMPNHLHSNLLIENSDCRNTPGFADRQTWRVHDDVTTINHDSNILHQNTPCLPDGKAKRVPTGNIGPLTKNSLSSIINHFKGRVKRYCNKNKFEYFAWQSRFYDHIIRNEKSLINIRQYIRTNPGRWQRDRNNQEGLMM